MFNYCVLHLLQSFITFDSMVHLI